jgi:hypothetical protein
MKIRLTKALLLRHTAHVIKATHPTKAARSNIFVGIVRMIPAARIKLHKR